MLALKLHDPETGARMEVRGLRNAEAAGPRRDERSAGAAIRAAALEDDSNKPRVELTHAESLCGFFEKWFLPIVLEVRETRAATIDRYRQMLKWWTFLTTDPPLADVDDRLVAEFVKALKKVEYQKRPLKAATVKTHCVMLKTLLTKTGSGNGGAGVLDRAIFVPVPKLKYSRLDSFTLEEARAVAVACERMRQPVLPRGTTAQWWRAWLAMFYYTGLRTGTIRSLCWRHVETEGDQTWLNVPAGSVKTKKAIRLIMHPQLVEALRPFRHQTHDQSRILPQGCCPRWLITLHERPQKMAGLRRPLSPHAWRRTHGQMLAELGLHRAEELAKVALDHADVRTTLRHYVSVVDSFRLKLPLLWPHGVSDEKQAFLF